MTYVGLKNKVKYINFRLAFTGVFFDKKVWFKVKGTFYITVEISKIVYKSKYWELNKRERERDSILTEWYKVLLCKLEMRIGHEQAVLIG